MKYYFFISYNALGKVGDCTVTSEYPMINRSGLKNKLSELLNVHSDSITFLNIIKLSEAEFKIYSA